MSPTCFAFVMFVVSVLPPNLLVAALSWESSVVSWMARVVGAISLVVGAAMAVLAWLRVVESDQPVQGPFLVRLCGWLLLMPPLAGVTILIIFALAVLVTSAQRSSEGPSVPALLLTGSAIAAWLAGSMVGPRADQDRTCGAWIERLHRSVRRSSLVLALVTVLLMVVVAVAWLLKDESDHLHFYDACLILLTPVLGLGVWMAASTALSLAWSRRLSPLPDPPPRSVRRRLDRTT